MMVMKAGACRPSARNVPTSAPRSTASPTSEALTPRPAPCATAGPPLVDRLLHAPR